MKRIEYLDAIKGFAILLMLIGHAIAWNIQGWQDILPIQEGMDQSKVKVGLIWNFIYAFHMAVFFFVSGFLSYKENSDLRTSLLQKTKRLLIPYLVTGAMLIPLKGYFGYWFLFSLWQLSIIGCLFNQFLPKPSDKSIKPILIDTAVICTVFVVCKYIFSDRFFDNPLCEQDKFVSYYFPFMGGVILRKYEGFFKWVQSHFTVCFVGFVLFFINRYLSFEQDILQLAHTVMQHIGFYLMPILGTLTVWEIFRRGVAPPLQRFFSIIGKHTFEIYIFHTFFIVQIPSIGLFWLQADLATCLTTQLLYSITCSAIAIGLSLSLTLPIKHSKLLNKLVLGSTSKSI